MTTLTIFLYDGQPRPFAAGNVLLYIRSGGRNLVAKYVNSSAVDLRIDDGLGNLVIVASRSGFRDCGYFISDLSKPVYLMLVHKNEFVDYNLYETFVGPGPRGSYAELIGSDGEAKKVID